MEYISIIQIFLILMFFFFSYLILIRKNYYIISGFHSSTSEEQQKMIQAGYPRAVGKMLLHVGIILTLGFLLQLFHVPYAIEGSYIVMLIVIFIESFWMTKKVKKKSRRINKTVLGLSLILVIVVFAIPFMPNKLEINADSFEMTGLYGDEWAFSDMEDISLYDELPEITIRTNGISLFGKHLGNYRIEEWGTGKLFIRSNEAPFIVVHTEDSFVIINTGQADKTREQYQQLEQAYQQYNND
ncbi:hypothetical protein J18TS1_11500 [Oceanobacillus oncorhynchi subsp. incaldanensis]|uniref:DUF3784 domain-containing protein n=1 Tax=Oceanobacillus TaxID=182709 RepID=UPI001B042C96|nr:DUF3784 domain-containing protein [Oceanobacillus oncorhynchi]GIO18050.1 hypothetical protein J18TS1_11500 [Oceanobacillus oncorhynchi subsp. incaldanensis]